jgi:cysteinyl-tRNA synthetase
MQRLIGALQQRGHAYEAAGEMLFAVDSMPDYGALSGRNLEDNVAGARVAVEAHKRNPADFVLWKQSSDDEPGWDSPWGRGRPGWHIECSAMSERYLGQVFDIHAGGLDLIFPHHENEIAQSRCAHGTETMARYWLHNGFLQVEGEKMSKSLGNFVTIHELLETEKFGGRRWPGEVLRLAMLMTHYREPIDFTVKRLEEAEDKLRGWQRTASAANGTGTPDPSVIEALADDLNFHRASVAMEVIARKANRGVETAVECLAATLEFFGFPVRSLLTDPLVFDHSRIDDAVTARLAALNAKDFAKADQIRAALLAEGIQLMDGKNEAGERVTKWEIKR